MNLTFRDLTENDIDCRIQSVKENGLVLLLYKNARVDMAILDETVGASNWQREHYECKGNLFCRVGILCKHDDDDGYSENWTWKSDCGTESNTEKEKGEASDSFKRACFNWGIGRELYTAPFTWIKAADCNITEYKGKLTCFDRFHVEKIRIENKVITGLSIWNDTTNKRAFVFK